MFFFGIIYFAILLALAAHFSWEKTLRYTFWMPILLFLIPLMQLFAVEFSVATTLIGIGAILEARARERPLASLVAMTLLAALAALVMVIVILVSSLF